MRKGYKLEAQIQRLLDYVNAIGYHAHKNHPKRTVDGIYIEGEPFDYEVMTKSTTDCFDAKEVQGSVWRLQKKDIVQADHLKHVKNAGARAYFLVQFGVNTYPLMIDIDKVIERLKSGNKSVTKDMGIKWDLVEVVKNDGRADN